MGQLDGKTALVTGGTSGIGLATAQRLADEGAEVFITGRDRTRLDAAAASIGAHGVQSDISKPEDLDILVTEIAKHGKGLDVVFANAGGGDFATLVEVTPQHYRDNFDRNVAGTVFTVQKALPLMSAGGAVVLTGSGAGAKGFANLSVYSATKAAIRSFARTWTTDLKSQGIRVNVVSPGMVLTPAMQTYLENNAGAEEWMRQTIPFGRLAQTEEVARAVLFLASDESSFVGGEELLVDGGFVAV